MKDYDTLTFRALEMLPLGLTLAKATIKHDAIEDAANYQLSEILMNWKPSRSKLTIFQLPKKGNIKFDINIENGTIVVRKDPTVPKALETYKIKEMKLHENRFEFEDNVTNHTLRIEEGFTNSSDFKVLVPERERTQ